MSVNVLCTEKKKKPVEWKSISFILLFCAFYFDRFKRYIYMWTFSLNNFIAVRERGAFVFILNAISVTLRVKGKRREEAVG